MIDDEAEHTAPSTEPDVIDLVGPMAPHIEVAVYIAELTDELARVARRTSLPMLPYLLDMAAIEARKIARLQFDRRATRVDPDAIPTSS